MDDTFDLCFDYPRRARIAAIGAGGHAARNVLPALQYAPADLVAMCDLNRSRAEDCGRLFGATSIYTDYQAMLREQKPDGVVVVTNYDENGHPRYPKIAEDVMRAGAHVWIEKPPAASAEQIRGMMRTSRETNRHVMVGFKKMFFPAHRRAKQIITSDGFGAVSTITARYPQVLPPLADRGDDRKMIGFLDHMVHPWSLLLYLAGPTKSIYVQRSADGGSITSIKFSTGAIGALHMPAHAGAKSPLERTEIIGGGASLVIENGIRLTHYRGGDSGTPYGRSGSYYTSDAVAPLVWEPEFSLGQLYNKGIFVLGYAAEIRAFCEHVLEGAAPTIGSLDDALHLLNVYEAYRKPEGIEYVIRDD